MTKTSLVVGALLLAGAQISLQAQDRPPDANRVVVVEKTDLATVIDNVAKRSGDFKGPFDSAVGRAVDGKFVEDRAKHRADELHDAAKKLKDVFGDKRDKNAPPVRERVDQVLAAGSELNKIMQDHRFTDKLQNDWNQLLGDLNALAAVYQLTPIG
jgi:hypothetical protein